MSGPSKLVILDIERLPRFASNLLLPVFGLLSVLIIIFPFHYSFGFSQIEGLQISSQPWLFAAIIDLWVLLGVISMSHARTSSSRVIEVLLVTTMAIVPGLLTVKMAPLGVDHSYSLTFYGVSYIGSTHNIPIPPPTQVTYLEYPGIMLMTYCLSSIIGLSPVVTGSILQVAFYTVTGIAIYKLTKILTGNAVVSSLALPLFFFCSIESGNFLLFFPATMGASLMILVFLLIARPRASVNTAEALVLSVLILGMTITHFYDPLDLIFVLTLLYLTMARRPHGSHLGFALFFASISFAAYFLFFAVSFFGPVVIQSVYSFSHIFSGIPQLYALQVISANTLGIPLWAVASKYLDLTLTSIAGSAIAFYMVLSALRRKKLDSGSNLVLRYSVAAVGILIFGAAIFLAALSSGGSAADFFAALQWVAFFSLPLVLFWAARSRKLAACLVVVTAVISAPSLFSLITPQISTISVHPSNIAASSYVANHEPQTSFAVLTDGKNSGVLGFFDPFAKPDFYTIPLSIFSYNASEVNIVDTGYSNYQLHLYGFPINYSSVYRADIVYNAPQIYVIPPMTA